MGDTSRWCPPSTLNWPAGPVERWRMQASDWQVLPGSTKVTSAFCKTDMENRILTSFIPDSGTMAGDREGLLTSPAGLEARATPGPGWRCFKADRTRHRRLLRMGLALDPLPPSLPPKKEVTEDTGHWSLVYQLSWRPGPVTHLGGVPPPPIPQMQKLTRTSPGYCENEMESRVKASSNTTGRGVLHNHSIVFTLRRSRPKTITA